jgi:broad specificity phosphatase PhoE
VLVLLRHGESTANAAGLLLGRHDPPLTESGRLQAARLGRSLGPVTRIISSPLQRARDSAGALGIDAKIEVDERWIEVDYGEHDGRPISAVPSELWQRWRSDPDFAPPGGESLRSVGDRVALALGELFESDATGARDPTGDVVVVSHVSPIKAAIAWTLGAPAAAVHHLFLATGSATRIGWGPVGVVLHSYNVVPPPEFDQESD